jgi:hypothetical protein
MKTSNLVGKPLDWAVAKAEEVLYPKGDIRLFEGRLFFIEPGNHEVPDGWRKYDPSENWAQGGPILESECMELSVCATSLDGMWVAKSPEWYLPSSGPTPLVAAMRCLVQSKLGSEVDVPEELL